jgi:hypothetical protein
MFSASDFFEIRVAGNGAPDGIQGLQLYAAGVVTLARHILA